jgi:hypothetical protein
MLFSSAVISWYLHRGNEENDKKEKNPHRWNEENDKKEKTLTDGMRKMTRKKKPSQME